MFYVAGARHYLECDGNLCKDSIAVTRGDEVFLIHEATNLYDKNAICIVDRRQRLLGYVPRYYAQAFVKFIEEGRIEECHVASVTKEKCCDECIGVIIKIAELKSDNLIGTSKEMKYPGFATNRCRKNKRRGSI